MNPRDGVELMETQPCGLKDDPDGGNKGKEAMMETTDDDKTPDAYDCNICGRSFPFLSSLSQHMRRHTGARPYKCPYCDHRASQKGNLKVHIRSHKLGTLSSHHANDDDEDGEEAAAAAAEVGVSEGGTDGGTSPTKSSSACNAVAEEGKRKPPARSGIKREKLSSDARPFCCRLCGYEAQREDQLLSHIEKVHITADADDEGLAAAAAAKDEAEEAAEAASQSPDGTFPCETCGQVFTQAWFLKSHMKKHAGLLEHCCHICGRRFREAWFLKSHMKTHSAKSRSRTTRASALAASAAENSSEPPATINDVAQDPDVVSGVAAASAYQICSKCGNLFHSRESLRAHEKVHGGTAVGGRTPRLTRGQRGSRDGDDDVDDNSPAAKRRLLDYLNLRSAEETPEEEHDDGGVEEKEWKCPLGQRIPELDPVCSYQAWQLATRGRVVEPMEPSYKASSGEGRIMEDHDQVVYEKENGRFVLKGQQQQERRSSGRRSNSSRASSSGSRTPESLSDSEYRPASRQDRRRSSQTSTTTNNSNNTTPSKSNECFECGKVFRSRHQMVVHQRVHQRKDVMEKSSSSSLSGGEKDRATAAAGGRGGGVGGDRWGSTSDPESGSPSRPSTPLDGGNKGKEAMMETTADDEKTPGAYDCNICGRSFPFLSSLSQHMQRHTGYGDSSPPTPALGGEPQASGTDATAAADAAGQLADEKPYVCSLCDFVAADSSSYLSHVRVQHPADRDGRPSPAPGSSSRPSPAVSSCRPSPAASSKPSPAASPSPTPSSSSDRGVPDGYPKLKMALLQGLPHPPYISPSAYVDIKPQPSSDPGLTPLDLCIKVEVRRGLSSSPAAPLDKRGLPSHKCSFCSYASRYPEVLWMHQTVSHRISSSSSALAPKWALRNGLKRPRDGSSSSSHVPRRRTGPPPVLEGKECPPLPPVVRTPRTQPPGYSPAAATETPKKNKPNNNPSNPPSTSSSTLSSRGSSSSQAARHAARPSGSGAGAGRPPSDHHHQQPSHSSRPRVDLYTPRGASSSSSLEKNAAVVGSVVSHHQQQQSRPSLVVAQPPAASAGARLADRYVMPQEGLGFMLSSKHGLAEYSRARSSPQESNKSILHHQQQQQLQHHPHHHHSHHHQHHHHQSPQAATNSHSQVARAAVAVQGLSRPSAITHSSSIGHHRAYGTSSSSTTQQQTLPHLHNSSSSISISSSPSSSSSLSSSSSSQPRSGDVKQESTSIAQEVAAAQQQETSVDILSFLKNYSPHELAALYHRWGAANALLDPTGMLRSLMRQGQYVCHECGKSFSQPSHLRTHMRSHTGERPFCCRLCPYRASQKGNLKTHVQSVHHLPFDNDRYPESSSNGSSSAGSLAFLHSLGPPPEHGDPWTLPPLPLPPQQQQQPTYYDTRTDYHGRASGADHTTILTTTAPPPQHHLQRAPLNPR